MALNSKIKSMRLARRYLLKQTFDYKVTFILPRNLTKTLQNTLGYECGSETLEARQAKRP
jgi:hypothetical protein